MTPSRFAALMSVLTLAAACGSGTSPAGNVSPSGDAAAADPAGSLPSGHPMVEARSMSDITAEQVARTGTVLELLDGGGYTYARVKVGEGREMWIAGPATPLTVGQEIGIGGAVSMGAFSSATLERTFDDLYFVGSFVPDGPPPGATRGEALEVLEGGGYTYVRARTGEVEQWVAGPQTAITVGDVVAWAGGMDMGEFHSPTLERTFESVLFVGRFWVEAR